MTALFFILVFLLLGLGGYLIWALHKRVEALAILHGSLAEKVKEGEHVVIENFVIIEKRFKKVEHEIKEINRVEPKIKEAGKAISRLQRNRE